MKFLCALAAVMTLGLAGAGTANAVPTAVGLGAFASGPIDANVADDVEITNQFAGSGLTFSGGLFGSSDAAFVPGGGPLVVSNFTVNCGATGSCGDITVTLASSAIRFGLVVATRDDSDVTLTLFSGATNLGSLNYTTDGTGDFIGIEELGGFDRVVIDAFGPSNGALIGDLFRFDLRTDTPAVPEPATLALLGVGLLGLAAARRRRRIG